MDCKKLKHERKTVSGKAIRVKADYLNNLSSHEKKVAKSKKIENFEYNIEVLEPYTKRLFETYTDETYKDINFFRSNRTRHLIVLKCIEYFCGKKDLTFEKLINYIPSQHGSRSHKINCIKEMCDRGILQRIDNLYDKRSTLIQPTTYIIKLYSKLHYSYKEILYDFKTFASLIFLFFLCFDF
jgi:hypothetical protein